MRDRNASQRLVRYPTRPPIAMGRLSAVRDGSVAYRVSVASHSRVHAPSPRRCRGAS